MSIIILYPRPFNYNSMISIMTDPLLKTHLGLNISKVNYMVFVDLLQLVNPGFGIQRQTSCSVTIAQADFNALSSQSKYSSSICTHYNFCVAICSDATSLNTGNTFLIILQ